MLSRFYRPLSFLTLLGVALFTGACAEPTVEEIRDQAQSDLKALLRHSSATFDEASNRAALNNAATRLGQLGGKDGSVDLFGDVNFDKEIEHLIVELDDRVPKLFSEENVIADIDDGKRFRFSLDQLCMIFSDEASCQDTQLNKISLDFDVTTDGDTVRIAVALAGKQSFGSVSISASRLLVDVDGAKVLTFINDINAIVGEAPVKLEQLAGNVRIDWRRDGAGLRVEATLANLLFEQEVAVSLPMAPTSPRDPYPEPQLRMARVIVDVPSASVVAQLGEGKASVKGTLEPRQVQWPIEARDASLVAGAFTSEISADGSGALLLTTRSAGPVVLEIDGKTALSATLDKDNVAVEFTLAPRGSKTSITLGPAIKPSFEIYPEVLNDGGDALQNPRIEGDFSAGLSLLPRGGATMLEVLEGSAELRSGDQSMTMSKGQCLLEAEPAEADNFLDFMATGSCG